jgi:hypothetical protein
MAPQLRGEAGTPREWVFNQLAAMWYVRDAKWKLNEKNELYDMSDAPYTEKLVTGDHPARTKLAAVLTTLDPAGGIPDSGDGTGRHANKSRKEPDTNLSPEEAERAEKFDKIDAEKAGKISREAFISSQSDPETAAKRFGKYDADKDGQISREEFVYRGQKKS